MARYIVQHRRGSAAQWADKNTVIPMEGEIVIELDEANSLHKLKIGDGIHTYAELAYLQAGDEIVTQVLAEAKPRVVSVTLAETWNQDAEGKYSQVISLDNITEHSRLDLQPTADMIAEFKQLGLVFVTENNGGTITVYSVGNAPLKSYTMQATIVETECDGEDTCIVGIPIGAPAIYDDIREQVETRNFGENNTIEISTGFVAGGNNTVSGNYASSFGVENQALGTQSFTEGWRNIATGESSHAEGFTNEARGSASHAEGANNYVKAANSHVEGAGNVIETTSGAAHAEGASNTITAWNAHAEGANNTASGANSHVEGNGPNTASGNGAHAEGYGNNTASGDGAHAEGYNVSANGLASHAEGRNTQATASYAHSEGYGTIASGALSHAQNNETAASGWASSAAGNNTKAGYSTQFVVGKFNANKESTIFEVGNGTDDYNRSNAFEVRKDNTAYINTKKIATEEVVDNKLASLVGSAPETLDTLNELAQALGDDPNFATTVATEIGKKVDKVDGKGLSTNDFTDDYKAKVDVLSGSIDGLATEEFVTSAIDDIEIGGRNLLLNTNQGTTNWRINTGSGSDVLLSAEDDGDGIKLTITTVNGWLYLSYSLESALEALEPNTEYQLSFDWHSDVPQSASGVIMCGDSSGKLTTTCWHQHPGDGIWVREICSLTTNDLSERNLVTNRQILYLGFFGSTASTICIRNLKLEKGNKATQWTPAPEDLSGTVKYTTAQNLSEAHKAQARANIGAMSADTVIPSLSGYATETYVNNAVSSKSNIGHTHSASSITGNGYLVTHPEYSSTIIPFIHNDLAFLNKKGGSCSYYETTDTDLTSLELTKNEGSFSVRGGSEYNIFDGTPSYAYLTVSEDTTIVIDLVLHQRFDYANKFYIDFGNEWWKITNIAVYVMNSVHETSYTFKNSITDNAKSYWYCDLAHEGTLNDGSQYYGYDRIRIVLSGYHGNLNPRIAEIGLINYGSQGVANTFVSRGGCNGMYGDLLPHTNNTINLGSSSKKWNNVYTDKINDKAPVTSSDSTPMEIVASGTQPTPVEGKTIVWIDTSALS